MLVPPGPVTMLNSQRPVPARADVVVKRYVRPWPSLIIQVPFCSRRRSEGASCRATHSVPLRTRSMPCPIIERETCSRPEGRTSCESAWNKDPVFGVIGIQSGPPGRWVHSGLRGGYGGQVGDAGGGDYCEDPSGVFRPEQTH